MRDLNLGLIGNCCFAALIDRHATVVWCCLPRFDGEPVFHGLLGAPADAPDSGVLAVDLQGFTSSHQSYVPNTAILRTVLKSEQGEVEVIDFVPRFPHYGRTFRPLTLVRRLRVLSGAPRIRLRIRPRFDFGATAPTVTRGSNHIRYVGAQFALRLNTDAPIDYVIDETFFSLREPINLILGADETLGDGIADTARQFEERTEVY